MNVVWKIDNQTIKYATIVHEHEIYRCLPFKS